MEYLKVFAAAPVASLISDNGITAAAAAATTVCELRRYLEKNGTAVIFWNDGKVSFSYIYIHTIKVPAKALRDVSSLAAWVREREAHYKAADMRRIFGN